MVPVFSQSEHLFVLSVIRYFLSLNVCVLYFFESDLVFFGSELDYLQ